MPPLDRKSIFAKLPPEPAGSLLPAVRDRLARAPTKLVVFDDDPTGTQTVHDIPLLTSWGREELAQELQGVAPGFFVLTNTRGMPPAAAAEVAQACGANLKAAQRDAGVACAVVSRSDSTLRGHFPVETDAMADGLGETFDLTLIVPAFFDGGRYTIDNVHYVAEGDRLVPAAETEFAMDFAFGYQHSDLRDWVEEKTNGRVARADVATLSLEELREAAPETIARRLQALPRGTIAIANAAAPCDLHALALVGLEMEAAGRRLLYRTAASFVAARLGLPPRALLRAADLGLATGTGGLTIVGSYVAKTTTQLAAVQADAGHREMVELSVAAVLDPAAANAEIARVIQRTDTALAAGRDVVVFTSRERVAGADAAEGLALGQRISEALVTLLRNLQVRPRYLIGKGGITSHVLATAGLGVKRAMVRGQLSPGVPVWDTGPETRFPGMPYVVFPGNVGGPEALRDMIETLNART